MHEFNNHPVSRDQRQTDEDSAGVAGPHKKTGRGAGCQPPNPYLAIHLETNPEEAFDDQEHLALSDRPPSNHVETVHPKTVYPKTVYIDDQSQSIVSHNDSPDISFNYSVNPYRGCVHGCSYCYARPTHEYLGFSSGIDFETKVLVKRRAPELLRDWLARPQWRPEMIAFSGVTDCYQPVERELGLTRGCLAVAAECRQPIGIVTKNGLVTRDIDLLTQLASFRAVRVAISITTLDQSLTRLMEPRTSAPAARLAAIAKLADAGVPTDVLIAPVIPGLNDSEIPAILDAAKEAGADHASYTLLRLPTTVSVVFLEWLRRCRPNEAAKVEAFVREARGGELNSSQFGERHRGHGARAEQIAQLFRVFSAKHGLNRRPEPLSAAAFRPPRSSSGQGWLF